MWETVKKEDLQQKDYLVYYRGMAYIALCCLNKFSIIGMFEEFVYEDLDVVIEIPQEYPFPA